MKKMLYVNSCLNLNESRTERLSQAWLKRKQALETFSLKTIILEKSGLIPLNTMALTRRNKFIVDKNYSDASFNYAKDFASADEVLISAPYWDMSFPAMLKIYFENVCVNGLTFEYVAGKPHGLTQIKAVTYITTAGGYIGNNDFGFQYVKGVCNDLFQIKKISCYAAEGLDIKGNDVDSILSNAFNNISIDHGM